MNPVMDHLNRPGILPPVDCPLLIEVPGLGLVRATRPAFVTDKGNDLTYRLEDDTELVGRFPWTYP